MAPQSKTVTEHRELTGIGKTMKYSLAAALFWPLTAMRCVRLFIRHLLAVGFGWFVAMHQCATRRC